MELRCRVEGEEGVVAEKMDKYFLSEGSDKDGEEVGLFSGGEGRCDEVVEGRGGKSTIEVKEGTEGVGKGFEEGID